MRYAHTNLIAADWRRLARFYERVFGCTPVPPERHLSGEWLERGTGVPGACIAGMHLRLPGVGPEGPTLEIFAYAHGAARIEAPPDRPGLGHLAFEVDDVPAVLEEVVAAGGRALGEVVETAVPGAGRITFVYASDPEGNVLELQSWRRKPLDAEAVYDAWATTYDTDENATRDADAVVLRRLLPDLTGMTVLELGSGTGKNTEALLGARAVAALDLSWGMLATLRRRMVSARVAAVRHDARQGLPFASAAFDLVTADLVLEHVEHLEPLLGEMARVLRPGGRALVVELHPHRQARGGRARFRDGATGAVTEVAAFAHTVAEFVASALGAGLFVDHAGEWDDEGEPWRPSRGTLPRLVSLGLRR